LVAQLKVDHRTAGDDLLGVADRAMLDYTEKLTVAPATMVEADIVALRTAGFTDEAIVEVNQIGGFFAWCNRTVDGLGVQLESFWDDPNVSNI